MLRIRHPLAVLAATAAAGAALAAPAAAAPVQRIFAYTGAVQTWQVPPGVTEATFTLVGQSGASGAGPVPALGGQGAELRATLPVIPGQVYEVWVGGSGAAETPGFSAGGSASALTEGAGGGGGAGGQSYAINTAHNVSTELAATRGNGVAVVSYEPLSTPEVRTQPSLSGVAEVGRQLTCELGTWSGSPTLAVAWLRNGTPIANATTAQYTLQTADGGQQVACQVTATNAVGSTVARTPAIGVPVLAGPANTAPPAVTGTAAIGSRVTCNPGTWGGSPAFAYTWLRNGRPIANQTQSTYTLSRADAGMTVQCAVRATADGLSTTAQSVAVGGPARLVILNQTALVSRAGSVTVVLGCFGSTDCRVARVTATSGQVIARSGRRVVRAGATSRVVLTLGRRGLSKLRRAGSSIPVRFVSLPEGGYGGNVRMTWVALRGTS